MTFAAWMFYALFLVTFYALIRQTARNDLLLGKCQALREELRDCRGRIIR